MQAYRPKSLEELIGCDGAKETIRVALSASKVRNDAFPHTLITGAPGLGKTTISKILAKERGSNFKEFLANIVRTKDDVKNLLASLDFEGYTDEGEIEGEIKPTILFLDEIHMLDKKCQEAFFQAMEDFTFSSDKKNSLSDKTEKKAYWVPRFTLIGATTKVGMLDKAFIERFKLKFDLEPYSEADLIKIIMLNVAGFDCTITEDAAQDIAKRSRGVARKAINFLERAFDTAIFLQTKVINKQVIEKTFELLHIDSLGLESIDIQVLRYLYTIYPQRVGVARLSNLLSVGEIALKDIVEPYLLRQGLIDATPGGRIITEKGMVYCDKTGIVDQTISTPTVTRRIDHA